jgi:hypothetical protein
MTTRTTTINTIAISIYNAAKDAGATLEMLRSYDLTSDDCDAIRSDYLADSDESELASDEMRAVILDVEARVREIARAAA